MSLFHCSFNTFVFYQYVYRSPNLYSINKSTKFEYQPLKTQPFPSAKHVENSFIDISNKASYSRALHPSKIKQIQFETLLSKKLQHFVLELLYLNLRTKEMAIQMV